MDWRGMAVRALARALAGAAALVGQAASAAVLEDCAAIEDAGARLACIDRLASTLPPATVAAGNPASPAAAADPSASAALGPRPSQETALGRGAGGSRTSQQGAVHSSIILLDRLAGGELVFRLTNGQAWVQQAARFVAVEVGERVVIAPARLGGGHILATERSAAARVRRLE